MRKFRAVRDKLMVKVPKVEEFSKGGILLTEDTLQKEQMAMEEAIIISLGCPDFFEQNPESVDFLKVGDRICMARYGGKTVGKDVDGSEIRVIKDVDVLCVIEEE